MMRILAPGAMLLAFLTGPFTAHDAIAEAAAPLDEKVEASAPPLASPEGYVIIATTGVNGSVLPGQRLTAADPLELPLGAKVSLISANGEIITLLGPRSGPITNKAPAPASKKQASWREILPDLSRILKGEAATTNVLGASRLVEENHDFLEGQPELWVVNADYSGDYCVKPQGLELWRRDSSQALVIAVQDADTKIEDLSWNATEPVLQLPNLYTPQEGPLAISMGEETRDFTLHILPEAIDEGDTASVLRWMVVNNCAQQVLSLAERLHRTSLVAIGAKQQ